MPPVEGDNVRIANSGAAEDVERGTDGQIDPASANSSDFLQICERPRPARVSRRDRRPLAKHFHQPRVDALAKPLDVHRVDQELITGIREAIQSSLRDGQVREFLPAIRDHEIIVASLAAAQIQHQPVFSDGLDQRLQAIPIQLPVPEDARSNDHLRSARVEIRTGVLNRNAATDLKSAGISFERGARGGFIARSEHDDMAAFEAVAFVKLGIPRGGTCRDEVDAQSGGIVAERAADDLLHLAFVEVNAGAEHVFALLRGRRRSRRIRGVSYAATPRGLCSLGDHFITLEP